MAPPLEVADIFREHARRYLRKFAPLPTDHKRVLRLIQVCRTAALGGHLDQCDHCGYQEISYNSCRNRHCPKCQGAARVRWLEARRAELLPTDYFHLVFTIPAEIRRIAYQNKRTVYGILFRAAAQTLRQVARDPRHLGADIGFFGILHTWGQNLLHHPHVHFVVPGGGLSPERDRWIPARKKFFLPVAVLRVIFRAKFLDFLGQAFDEGELSFRGSLCGLAQPAAFKELLVKASKHDWVVYSKPPFGGPDRVLKYLARYTHRVAIANSRLVSLKDRMVTFRWKDYSDQNRKKLMTLDVMEFIRRFLLHTLPKGFQRIRYYGFLAPRNRQTSIQLCRDLLAHAPETASSNKLQAQDSTADQNPESPDSSKKPCPRCNRGRMILIERFSLIPPILPAPALGVLPAFLPQHIPDTS